MGGEGRAVSPANREHARRQCQMLSGLLIAAGLVGRVALTSEGCAAQVVSSESALRAALAGGQLSRCINVTLPAGVHIHLSGGPLQLEGDVGSGLSAGVSRSSGRASNYSVAIASAGATIDAGGLSQLLVARGVSLFVSGLRLVNGFGGCVEIVETLAHFQDVHIENCFLELAPSSRLLPEGSSLGRWADGLLPEGSSLGRWADGASNELSSSSRARHRGGGGLYATRSVVALESVNIVSCQVVLRQSEDSACEEGGLCQARGGGLLVEGNSALLAVGLNVFNCSAVLEESLSSCFTPSCQGAFGGGLWAQQEVLVVLLRTKFTDSYVRASISNRTGTHPPVTTAMGGGLCLGTNTVAWLTGVSVVRCSAQAVTEGGTAFASGGGMSVTGNNVSAVEPASVQYNRIFRDFFPFDALRLSDDARLEVTAAVDRIEAHSPSWYPEHLAIGLDEWHAGDLPLFHDILNFSLTDCDARSLSAVNVTAVSVWAIAYGGGLFYFQEPVVRDVIPDVTLRINGMNITRCQTYAQGSGPNRWTSSSGGGLYFDSTSADEEDTGNAIGTLVQAGALRVINCSSTASGNPAWGTQVEGGGMAFRDIYLMLTDLVVHGCEARQELLASSCDATPQHCASCANLTRCLALCGSGNDWAHPLMIGAVPTSQCNATPAQMCAREREECEDDSCHEVLSACLGAGPAIVKGGGVFASRVTMRLVHGNVSGCDAGLDSAVGTVVGGGAYLASGFALFEAQVLFKESRVLHLWDTTQTAMVAGEQLYLFGMIGDLIWKLPTYLGHWLPSVYLCNTVFQPCSETDADSVVQPGCGESRVERSDPGCPTQVDRPELGLNLIGSHVSLGVRVL